MRFRLPWILSVATLLAIAWWSHDRWLTRVANIVKQMRTGRFVDEASRSQAFLIEAENWLEFDLPPRGRTLRLLTNAGVKKASDPLISLDTERPGWRYAVFYQIVDAEGEILTESTYFFRTQLTEYLDPETRETYTAATFGDTELFPAGTRTMQCPLNGFARPAHCLRLRLAERGAEIDEVGVRVYCRKERPGYERSSTWQRISQRRKQKMCRASVYPPDLISHQERRNLVRWQWLPLPPRGLEGVDYQRRILYTLDEVSDQEAGSNALPLGQLVRKGLVGVIPLPAEEGTARIELERVVPVDSQVEPSLVGVQWYGGSLHQRRAFEIDLTGNISAFDFPAEGGLLVLVADVELVARAAWRPTTAPADEDFQDITPPPCFVPTCRTQGQLAVDFSVDHIDGWPTPFCVALRRPILGLPTPGGGPQVDQLEPIPVHWQFLDGQQQVMAQGQLPAGGLVSPYDGDMKHNLYVTEPSKYYFAVPRDVRRIRFQSHGPPVLISAFTRVPDLAKRTRVPEDYSAFSRPNSTNRNWFMLYPDNHLRLLEEGRSVSIQVRPRAAEDDPELVAGRYLWEDFRPSGFWQARYLLAPRDPDAPLRDEARTATFVELETGRDYDVRFIRDVNRLTIEPRLIYVKEDASAQSLDVLLDGALYHTAKLRAGRGEIVLPAFAAQDETAPHRLQVRSDGPVRLFLNRAEVPQPPSYLKRIALRTVGRLRFQYNKTVPGTEVLALSFYGAVGRKERAKLRVNISSPPSPGVAPSIGWTIRQRLFDLKPADGMQQSIVLDTTDQYMGAGRVCYIPLGEDLPVGRYPIEIELTEGAEGYMVLSKTTAGTALERSFLSDQTIDVP